MSRALSWHPRHFSLSPPSPLILHSLRRAFQGRRQALHHDEDDADDGERQYLIGILPRGAILARAGGFHRYRARAVYRVAAKRLP